MIKIEYELTLPKESSEENFGWQLLWMLTNDMHINELLSCLQ